MDKSRANNPTHSQIGVAAKSQSTNDESKQETATFNNTSTYGTLVHRDVRDASESFPRRVQCPRTGERRRNERFLSISRMRLGRK